MSPKKQRPPRTASTTATPKRHNRFWSLRSLLVGLIGSLLLYLAFSRSPGYRFVCQMLWNNFQPIREHPKAPFVERLGIKLGFTAYLLDYIAAGTPRDAVILFPDMKRALAASGQYPLDNHLQSKRWISYFLYPRTVVLATETDNPNREQAQYAVIVNGVGSELLEYPVGEVGNACALLPVRYEDYLQLLENRP